MPSPTLASRLIARSEPELNSGCLLWCGYVDKDGYGQIGVGYANGRSVIGLTHRAAWEVFNGPIPGGKCVCHRCDTPSCINVAHLFLGSVAENMADRDSKGRSGNAGVGEAHPDARLTEADVMDIRRSAGSLLGREAAAKHRVSEATVSAIRVGRTWKHLPLG